MNTDEADGGAPQAQQQQQQCETCQIPEIEVLTQVMGRGSSFLLLLEDDRRQRQRQQQRPRDSWSDPGPEGRSCSEIPFLSGAGVEPVRHDGDDSRSSPRERSAPSGGSGGVGGDDGAGLASGVGFAGWVVKGGRVPCEILFVYDPLPQVFINLSWQRPPQPGEGGKLGKFRYDHAFCL
jgi:hypothetical protein